MQNRGKKERGEKKYNFPTAKDINITEIMVAKCLPLSY